MIKKIKKFQVKANISGVKYKINNKTKKITYVYTAELGDTKVIFSQTKEIFKLHDLALLTIDISRDTMIQQKLMEMQEEKEEYDEEEEEEED